MTTVKKEDEALYEEWGSERYDKAIAIVSQMYQDCGGVPTDPKAIQVLAETSSDALKLFTARMCDLADRPPAGNSI